MMPEISLNILDIAENCVRAKAKTVTVTVSADSSANALTVEITDDGCGMPEEVLKKVTDPFYTTRTTRKVGLGLSFFRMAAELTGGSFSILSAPGQGTTVSALFVLDAIDRMPLGDMPLTMHTLVTMHEDIDWIYRFTVTGSADGQDSETFLLDTRKMRQILGDVSFRETEVSQYLMEYLTENTNEVITKSGIQGL